MAEEHKITIELVKEWRQKLNDILSFSIDSPSTKVIDWLISEYDRLNDLHNLDHLLLKESSNIIEELQERTEILESSLGKRR